ncbi:hypothetical protein PV325_001172 [Microctonus aethiopoides]|nr:hypothetical protein PV325_001172 [Microctonus aethiopoides]
MQSLAIGLAATPAPVYLSEIAILKDKTTLTACTNIASCGGIMLIYLIGFVIPDNWRWVAATSISIPLLSMTSILFFTPESPRWLLHKGRLLEAKKTLLRIRGLSSETVEFNNEFQQMVNYHEKPVKNIQYINNVESDQIFNNSVISSELDESKKCWNVLNALGRPEVWKPFCILNTYFLFQQFCGIYVVIAYAVDIVVHSGIIVDAYFITVIIGVIQFIGGVACVLCSHKIGRRSLSIISGVGMSIALGILGFYIQFRKGIDLSGNYSIIPIVTILIFVGTGSFGFLALPWAMIGELYPTKYVNFMGPMTCCISGIFNFISLQLYPILVKYDFGATIYFYFIICIIATVFIIIALPETHGHTKSEIEQLFKKTETEFCEIPTDSTETNDNCYINKYSSSDKRYILYDVNPPEGFNLRRDVYIRVAVFINHLVKNNKQYKWNLVLPPWGHLLHWRSRDIDKQSQLPWGTFFDIDSLKKFIPVIEMYDFFREYKSNNANIILDRVYILQNDVRMFETGDFNDKNEISNCSETQIIKYTKSGTNQFTKLFWGYQNISTKDVKCITYHGSMSNLIQNLKPEQYRRSYMFHHMEIPLHDYYGSVDFWRARRSMRYNSALYKIADEFREKYLNSTDERDNIKRPNDWRDEKDQRNAIGGPYLAIHLRRRDFVISRAETVPSIANAAKQLINKMKELKLNTIFVATDTNNDEYEELKQYLFNYKVYRYKPSMNVKNKFKDGGIAIIDQIICSTARYFIGTKESTFTFRIQEDREILGFPIKTTFNTFCAKFNDCKPGSQWTIVW